MKETQAVQSSQRVVVDEVNFGSLFHFPKILRSITMAFGPSRLVIGLIMVAAVMLFGEVWDSFASPTFHPKGLLMGPAIETGGLKPFEAAKSQAIISFNDIVEGALRFDTARSAGGLKDMAVGMPVALAAHALTFTIVFGLFFCFVLAIGGGAISRMTAVETAGRERLRMGDAMVFAASNWTRLLMALLLPLLLACVVCIVIAIVGWVLMLPWIDLIGGILYGGLIALGLIAAILLLGYAAGSTLLIPAVASENCDSADALQRAYAYAIARPVHLVGYGLTALAGLVIGYLVVAVVAVTTLGVTASLVQLWSWNDAASMAGGVSIFDLTSDAVINDGWPLHERFAGAAISFWQTLVAAVVAAYVFAYFFTASTIVYLLMRRVCDGQDISEIWRPGMIPGTQAPMPVPAAAQAEADSQTDAP